MRSSPLPVVGIACFLFVALFVAASPSLSASPAWTWQNPKPTGNTLRSVTFLDATTVVAVGDGGAVLRSNNAGLTWFDVDSQTQKSLFDVSFADPATGVAGSNGTLFRTSDGGVTWSPMAGPSTEFADVSLLDDQSAVISWWEELLQTSDGGATWQTHFFPEDRGVMSHWAFDLDQIVVVGGVIINASYPTAHIHLTTDGGATWTERYVGSFNTDLRSVSFSDDMNGTAVGQPGAVVRTTDGGLTWSNQSAPTQQILESVVQIDANRAIAVGAGGHVVYTSDGGNSWTAGVTNTGLALNGVASNGNVALAVGENGIILRSTDDGQTWQEISTSFTYSGIQAVWFLDAMHGTVVGEQGSILRTNDGGVTWTPQASGLTSALYDVRFTDLNNGTVVGNDGYILRTVDGGNTWTRRSRDTNLPLYAVAFDGPSTGYIGGYVTYKTVDAGATWTKLTNVPAGAFSDVSATAGTVTMVGGNWFIRRSVDGGATWTVNVLPWQVGFNGVHFVDANTGVAVGGDGTIVRTHDGGTTWTRVLTDTNRDLGAVSFGNALVGVAVGELGDMRVTTDGGLTWTAQRSGSVGLTDVHMIAFDSGTIVGTKGAILRLQPESPVPVLISSFHAQAAAAGVELTWSVYTDELLDGFNVYRSERYASRELQINTEMLAPDARAFTDKNARPGVEYKYTLVAFAESGPIRSAPAAATMPALEARLFQNMPNPFNPTTSIAYEVPSLSPVTLRVFSLDGSLVRTLVNRMDSAGRHDATWNGTDNNGETVASGLYFYRLTVGKTTLSKKMLLLK